MNGHNGVCLIQDQGTAQHQNSQAHRGKHMKIGIAGTGKMGAAIGLRLLG